MFLIYNTLTFSVVQRRPLLGSLRSLGVTRREVMGLVLAEAGLPVGFTYHSRREVAEEMVAAHAGPGPIRTYPLSSSGSRAAR